MEDAATGAGFHSARLVPEPVAAATYFTHQLWREVPPGSGVVVADLGGGTFDASVVASTESGFGVLSVDGSEQLGGVDIDHALLELLTERFGDNPEWPRLLNPQTTEDRRLRRGLNEDVRTAKERLSRHTRVDLPVPLVGTDTHFTRDELDKVTRPLLERAVRITRAAIRASRLPDERLSGVLLVGGASRMPLVASMLHRALGMAPVVLEQPELVVAQGATLTGAATAAPGTSTAEPTPPAGPTTTPAPRPGPSPAPGQPATDSPGSTVPAGATQPPAAPAASPPGPVTPAAAQPGYPPAPAQPPVSPTGATTTPSAARPATAPAGPTTSQSATQPTPQPGSPPGSAQSTATPGAARPPAAARIRSLELPPTSVHAARMVMWVTAALRALWIPIVVGVVDDVAVGRAYFAPYMYAVVPMAIVLTPISMSVAAVRLKRRDPGARALAVGTNTATAVLYTGILIGGADDFYWTTALFLTVFVPLSIASLVLLNTASVPRWFNAAPTNVAGRRVPPPGPILAARVVMWVHVAAGAWWTIAFIIGFGDAVGYSDTNGTPANYLLVFMLMFLPVTAALGLAALGTAAVRLRHRTAGARTVGFAVNAAVVGVYAIAVMAISAVQGPHGDVGYPLAMATAVLTAPSVVGATLLSGRAARLWFTAPSGTSWARREEPRRYA